MQKERKNTFLKWIYIFLTMISCLSIYDSSRLTKLKAAHVLFIGIVFVHLCIIFKRKYIPELFDLLKKYSLYLLILIDISFIIFVINQTEPSLVKTGTVKVLYQVITVLAALGAIYLFDNKSVDYTFYGFVAFNLLAILLAAKDTGSISQIISDTSYFLTSGGDAKGFMKHLELHDATFSFGIFLIHYFLEGLKDGHNRNCFFIAALFFFMGFKRIGIAAAALAIILIMILSNSKNKTALYLGRCAMWTFAIAGFGYIVFVRAGLFEYVMNELNIDMSGRENLYHYMESFYNISPTFTGYGLESIKDILASAGDIKVNNTYISRLSAVHNDFLRMYVELGFWGFLLWEWYIFIWLPERLKEYGKKCYISYIAITTYLAFTYFTDNTAMYFLVTIVYRLVPAYFAVSSTKQDRKWLESGGGI